MTIHVFIIFLGEEYGSGSKECENTVMDERHVSLISLELKCKLLGNLTILTIKVNKCSETVSIFKSSLNKICKIQKCSYHFYNNLKYITVSTFVWKQFKMNTILIARIQHDSVR